MDTEPSPNADFGLRLDIAQEICNHVQDLTDTHWGPAIPFPCSPCVAAAERIMDLAQRSG